MFTADFSGSLEAIIDIINAFKSDHIELEVASAGVGQISESDLNIAEAVKGTIFLFYILSDHLHNVLLTTLLTKSLY